MNQTRTLVTLVEPTDTEATAGVWTGLVVGEQAKHRGAHAAVIGSNGQPICIVGPASSKKSNADARLLAHLWNQARAANTTLDALN